MARGAVAHVAEKTAAGMPGSFTYDAIWVTSRAADGTVTRDETAGDVAHLGDLGAVLNHPGGLLVVPWTGPSTVHLVGSAGTLKLLDGHLYWTSCQHVSSSECGLTLRRAPVADLAAVEDLQPLPRLYYLAVSAGWVFVGTSTHLWAAPLGGGEAQDHDLGAFVRGIAATSEGAYAVVETREERSGGQFMPNVFERMPEGSGILRIDPVSGARTWFLEETVVSAMVLTPSGAIVARRVPHWPTERPTVDSAGCTELVELDADGRPGRVLWRDLRDISALAVDEGVLYWARAPTFTLQQYVERSNGDAALYSMRIPP